MCTASQESAALLLQEFPQERLLFRNFAHQGVQLSIYFIMQDFQLPSPSHSRIRHSCYISWQRSWWTSIVTWRSKWKCLIPPLSFVCFFHVCVCVSIVHKSIVHYLLDAPLQVALGHVEDFLALEGAKGYHVGICVRLEVVMRIVEPTNARRQPPVLQRRWLPEAVWPQAAILAFTSPQAGLKQPELLQQSSCFYILVVATACKTI